MFLLRKINCKTKLSDNFNEIKKHVHSKFTGFAKAMSYLGKDIQFWENQTE